MTALAPVARSVLISRVPPRELAAIAEFAGRDASAMRPDDWRALMGLLDAKTGAAEAFATRPDSAMWRNRARIRELIVEGDDMGATLLAQLRVDLGRGFGVQPAALTDGARGAHLLARSELPGFLADSKVGTTLFHATRNDATYASIVDRGFDLGHVVQAMYGRGIYASTVPEDFGQRFVELAVRSRKPLVVTTEEGFDASVDALRAAANPAAATDRRQLLLDAGYDSVIVRTERSDWVVALRDQDTRVVVADDALDRRAPTPMHLAGITT